MCEQSEIVHVNPPMLYSFCGTKYKAHLYYHRIASYYIHSVIHFLYHSVQTLLLLFVLFKLSLQGADPNCINKEALPVLHVAVKYKKVDAIPILVQEGAHVNAKGPK